MTKYYQYYKYLNTFICLLVLISSIGSITAYAVTSTPTIAPSVTAAPSNTSALSESLGEKINDLKERVASRVAQLRLVERRGIIGTVTNVSNTQITLSDIQNNIRFIDVDEITKFASPSVKETFGISDITKGTTVGILGLYNKESRRALARFVNVLVLPDVIHGAISSIQPNDYTFTFVTVDKHTYTVDIEKTTRTILYSTDAGLVKAGFSKIKEGQRAIVVGFKDPKNSKSITASRVIVFADVLRNPNIILSVPTPTPSPSATPTPTKKVIR